MAPYNISRKLKSKNWLSIYNGNNVVTYANAYEAFISTTSFISPIRSYLKKITIFGIITVSLGVRIVNIFVFTAS